MKRPYDPEELQAYFRTCGSVEELLFYLGAAMGCLLRPETYWEGVAIFRSEESICWGIARRMRDMLTAMLKASGRE